jgi:hypothetical protein
MVPKNQSREFKGVTRSLALENCDLLPQSENFQR